MRWLRVAESLPAAPRHGARPPPPAVSRAAARPRAVDRHAPLQRRRRSLDGPSASSSPRTTRARRCRPTGGHAVACAGYGSRRCVPTRAARAQLRRVAQRAVLRLCLNRLVSRDRVTQQQRVQRDASKRRFACDLQARIRAVLQRSAEAGGGREIRTGLGECVQRVGRAPPIETRAPAPSQRRRITIYALPHPPRKLQIMRTRAAVRWARESTARQFETMTRCICMSANMLPSGSDGGARHVE